MAARSSVASDERPGARRHSSSPISPAHRRQGTTLSSNQPQVGLSRLRAFSRRIDANHISRVKTRMTRPETRLSIDAFGVSIDAKPKCIDAKHNCIDAKAKCIDAKSNCNDDLAQVHRCKSELHRCKTQVHRCKRKMHRAPAAMQRSPRPARTQTRGAGKGVSRKRCHSRKRCQEPLSDLTMNSFLPPAKETDNRFLTPFSLFSPPHDKATRVGPLFRMRPRVAGGDDRLGCRRPS